MNAQPNSPDRPASTNAAHARRGLLADMRIRKKLIFLHTSFSVVLATILLVALRPAIAEVVERAERNEARLLATVLSRVDPALIMDPERAEPGLLVRTGSAAELGLTSDLARLARERPGEPVDAPEGVGVPRVVVCAPGDESGERLILVEVRIEEARRAVGRLYALTILALLSVYALVAISLEVFVLPHQVYGPIRRVQAADLAVREGRADEELIPEHAIPADELGQIMRSRNESIRTIREKEHQLSTALTQLETVATDLRRKNHLLEAARRNLADADRLASLGMMSAGIAHELNTPLAVLKGLVERLNADPATRAGPADAALMLRVVGRLERLSESLLDFARVRPPTTRPVRMCEAIEEAATLVRLDRDARGIAIVCHVPETLVIECDADRMVQVFVNLLRNAADAVRTRLGASPEPPGSVNISSEVTLRDGVEWAAITIADNGPGIDPAVLSTLFEPFVSTRLDSRGTGLGLAVSEGIVREHGGVILVRNLPNRSGAAFEILLPVRADASPGKPT
jgi:C4-dicarboxylate-specific signal transduction histidine kinase